MSQRRGSGGGGREGEGCNPCTASDSRWGCNPCTTSGRGHQVWEWNFFPVAHPWLVVVVESVSTFFFTFFMCFNFFLFMSPIFFTLFCVSTFNLCVLNTYVFWDVHEPFLGNVLVWIFLSPLINLTLKKVTFFRFFVIIFYIGL